MQFHVLGFTLDAWAALNLLIQFVLPLFVGLVTTKLTGRSSQALLLATLTLLATVGTQLLGAHASGQPVNPEQVILVAVVNFVVSTGAHYGLWKPTGLSALLLAMFDNAVTAPAAPAPDVSSAPAVSVPVPSAAAALTAVLSDPAPAGPRHAADPTPAPAVTVPAPSADPAPVPDRMAG